MHYYHLCVKGTMFHKAAEGPYTGLKDCGEGGGTYSSMRKHVKEHKHSPAETAPQQNHCSDVLRAAPLFRKNTGRLHKLVKTSALCAGLGVKQPGTVSVLPCSSLLPSYADTYLNLYLLIPVLLDTDVPHSAWIFPEAEAAAALGRCKYCLAHPLPSPLKACLRAQTHTHRHTHVHRATLSHIKLPLLKSDSGSHDSDNIVFYC